MGNLLKNSNVSKKACTVKPHNNECQGTNKFNPTQKKSYDTCLSMQIQGSMRAQEIIYESDLGYFSSFSSFSSVLFFSDFRYDL